MDATTRLKLDQLRDEAFKRLETDKRKATIDERESAVIMFVGTAEYMDISDGLRMLTQILKDLRLYPIYDCLAMWLDADYGLAYYEPQLILDVANQFLKEE